MKRLSLVPISFLSLALVACSADNSSSNSNGGASTQAGNQEALNNADGPLLIRKSELVFVNCPASLNEFASKFIPPEITDRSGLTSNNTASPQPKWRTYSNENSFNKQYTNHKKASLYSLQSAGVKLNNQSQIGRFYCQYQEPTSQSVVKVFNDRLFHLADGIETTSNSLSLSENNQTVFKGTLGTVDIQGFQRVTSVCSPSSSCKIPVGDSLSDVIYAKTVFTETVPAMSWDFGQRSVYLNNDSFKNFIKDKTLPLTQELGTSADAAFTATTGVPTFGLISKAITYVSGKVSSGLFSSGENKRNLYVTLVNELDGSLSILVSAKAKATWEGNVTGTEYKGCSSSEYLSSKLSSGSLVFKGDIGLAAGPVEYDKNKLHWAPYPLLKEGIECESKSVFDQCYGNSVYDLGNVNLQEIYNGVHIKPASSLPVNISFSNTAFSYSMTDENLARGGSLNGIKDNYESFNKISQFPMNFDEVNFCTTSEFENPAT